MGNLARVLFVHVPSAWLAYLSFVVTLVGSGLYLRTKDLRWDRFAASSAEVGVFFTTLAIALGMIWGRSTWGVWWTWDARLVLTAVMLFVYLGYLALRRSIPDRLARARRSAWLGILGIVQIPLVHFSVVWWRTLHQQATIFNTEGMQMDWPFRSALFAGLAAYTLVYVVLMRRRIELARLEDRFEDLVAAEEREVAGEAVTAPRYEGSTELEIEETPPPARSRRAVVLALAIAAFLVAAVAVVSSQATSLSRWGWVAYAYTVAYVAMLTYVAWLAWRITVTRRRVEEVS
ncbi:MAG: cytochrome c biogenesis protein CcsA [Actinobacteria bacterium]|nr:cytochrome c biogenesis protein CcsA [Actinomycetota bacterium]